MFVLDAGRRARAPVLRAGGHVLALGLDQDEANEVVLFLLSRYEDSLFPDKAPRPLYLTCRAALGTFYEKWGFRAIELAEMPEYYRRLARLASILTRIVRDDGMLVMVLQ